MKKKRDRRSECPTCHRGARPVMMEARTASAYHKLRWLVIRACDEPTWRMIAAKTGRITHRSRVADIVRALHALTYRPGGWELKLVRVRR